MIIQNRDVKRNRVVVGHFLSEQNLPLARLFNPFYPVHKMGNFTQNWYGIKWVTVLLINPIHTEAGRQTGGKSANYHIR